MFNWWNLHCRLNSNRITYPPAIVAYIAQSGLYGPLDYMCHVVNRQYSLSDPTNAKLHDYIEHRLQGTVYLHRYLLRTNMTYRNTLPSDQYQLRKEFWSKYE